MSTRLGFTDAQIPNVQIPDLLRKGLSKLNDNDNSFTALEAVPTEDWYRTWVTIRTIMVRRKATDRDEEAQSGDSPMLHQHTRAAAL